RAGQIDQLLGCKARREEGLPCIPGRTGGLAAFCRLADLLEARQIGESGIPDEVTFVVETAERENRHHKLLLYERNHAFDVDRGCLVIDVRLSALEHQAAVAAALDAEHRIYAQPEHLERKQRNEVERSCALRAVDEALVLEVIHIAIEAWSEIGRQV